VLIIAAQYAAIPVAGSQSPREEQAPSDRIATLSVTDNEVTGKVEGESPGGAISAGRATNER
jgi:hypothetical protein